MVYRLFVVLVTLNIVTAYAKANAADYFDVSSVGDDEILIEQPVDREFFS